MKTTSSIALVMFIILFSGCEKGLFNNSTGTYLSESKRYNAYIDVDKKIDYLGEVSSYITVAIVDAESKSYKIKDGWIKVNSEKMEFVVVRKNSNEEPYKFYRSGDIVEANTFYDFEIKLSDGTIYNSYITTREQDLYELNVPTTHSRNLDMKISWK